MDEQVTLTLADKHAEREIKLYDELIQKRYRQMVAEGTARSLALMFATRGAPIMGNSDRSFCEYQHERMSRGMDQQERTWITRFAQEAGIRTEGKTYMGEIGKYDDPLAWVSTREDAQTAMKAKGISTEGLIKVKSDRKPPKVREKRFVAPDLVEMKVNDLIKAEPKTREKLKKGKLKRDALRERVRGTFGPPETR
jgi:hypothetical protein